LSEPTKLSPLQAAELLQQIARGRPAPPKRAEPSGLLESIQNLKRTYESTRSARAARQEDIVHDAERWLRSGYLLDGSRVPLRHRSALEHLDQSGPWGQACQHLPAPDRVGHPDRPDRAPRQRQDPAGGLRAEAILRVTKVGHPPPAWPTCSDSGSESDRPRLQHRWDVCGHRFNRATMMNDP
jgi:hypothetical protein